MFDSSNFLNSEQLRATTFIRHVELHDTLGSTNDRAAELARDPAIELPSLIAARIQSAGKGRGSNKWWSAEGALTLSVLLDSTAVGISTQHWPQLSLATAVAICDAISGEAPEASPAIKWPNDIYVDGAKVCGILIESPGGAAPAKNRLIIGIGINVNNSWRTAPHDVGTNGTALCDVTGTRHDLQNVLVGTLQAMQARYKQLADGDSQLPQAWQQGCWLTGQTIDVQSNDRLMTGACIGIDTDGILLVENVDGVHRICSGSVRVA
jgi:BirA family transcriptional regulator, biotin operon repressor / biotin---[acetyl-CoA-carboxylase] ligase